MQIFSYTWQFNFDRDAYFVENIASTDARELQELRGLHRTARHSSVSCKTNKLREKLTQQ